MGLQRRGKSRVWFDDRGWWLINVEFQPSSGREGCYLNVGHQHLWVEWDHLIFLRADRPLGGSRFIELFESESAFRKQMAEAAAVAAETVQNRRTWHGEGVAALEKIAAERDDLEAGIALAVLGRPEEAKERLAGRVHDFFADQAAHYAAADSLGAAAIARAAIEVSRSNLGMSGPWADWTK
jgi:hypothetical protein